VSALQEIASYLAVQAAAPVLRVAIDGVDGVGKTTFCDLLAEALRSAGREVIRSSVDGFHNPRSIRYRLGRTPESFYRDSYDYQGLTRNLLDPLSEGGSLRYRSAIFDHVSDSAVDTPVRRAAVGSVLVFDGLFLHRPELRAYWDFSIFLDAPFEITVPRGASRGPGFGDPDPLAPSNQRYTGGNMIYFSESFPKEHASVIIDYADFSQPRIVAWKVRRQ
jgi:uridine kinase